MIRDRLDNKRTHELIEFDFSREAHGFGLHYTAGLGRYADGRLGEVFLDCHKLSSAATDEARDAAVTLSVALQHGMAIETLRHAVARFDDGRPCSLIGRLADVLTEYEAARVPPAG
ncbi:hypothetical protein BV511_03090 [Methylorubrum extorquens]|uniref:hypothetical protein n=1 Tax=Methylorubrum extorquens TaxID=408 RepID=UPI00097281AF|nr:hypothetical protein [Methylorubrum extorquens]APX83803.1 hypothetical protein BV511_03090 [Methylorubrum extorquens]